LTGATADDVIVPLRYLAARLLPPLFANCALSSTGIVRRRTRGALCALAAGASNGAMSKAAADARRWRRV